MTRQERLVKAWVKNDNMTLMDMYNKCNGEGWLSRWEKVYRIHC